MNRVLPRENVRRTSQHAEIKQKNAASLLFRSILWRGQKRRKGLRDGKCGGMEDSELLPSIYFIPGVEFG
jgi:hypothetical protein